MNHYYESKIKAKNCLPHIAYNKAIRFKNKKDHIFIRFYVWRSAVTLEYGERDHLF